MEVDGSRWKVNWEDLAAEMHGLGSIFGSSRRARDLSRPLSLINLYNLFLNWNSATRICVRRVYVLWLIHEAVGLKNSRSFGGCNHGNHGFWNALNSSSCQVAVSHRTLAEEIWRPAWYLEDLPGIVTAMGRARTHVKAWRLAPPRSKRRISRSTRPWALAWAWWGDDDNYSAKLC